MGKKFTESKGFNIILAILIAVGLWVYVTGMVNNQSSTQIDSVPVTVLGKDVLTGKGFMLDPSVKLTVDLRLTGGRTSLATILNNVSEYITVTVDVSAIDEPGSHELPVKVQLNNAMTAGLVSVEGKNNKTLTVGVFKMLEKTLEIQAEITQSVPDGYRANRPEITPSTVQIQGPEDVVNQVQSAKVYISGDLSKTYSGELGFSYVAADGSIIKDSNITASVDTVSVILPVVKTVEVPLNVDFIYGGGITKENFERYVTYTIEPAAIQISGDEKDIAPLEGQTLTLGKAKIDLATIDTSATIKVPITLTSELSNDSGISEATVTVKISGLETKTFETSNIEIINAADGFTPEAVTQSLQVKVRGPADAMTTIDGSQLRVVVDLENESLRHGSQFNFTAKIYLDGDSQCGVVTGERGYGIVVNIQ